MKNIDFQCVDGIPTEISDFWISFSYGSPVTFVQRGDVTTNADTAKAIADLNNQYALTDSIKDLQKLGRFVTITGIAYSFFSSSKFKRVIDDLELAVTLHKN